MSLNMDQFHRDYDGPRKNPLRREQRMNWKTGAVLLSGLLVACAQQQSPEATTPPEPAQASVSAPAETAAPAPAPAPAPAQTPAPAPGQAQSAAPAQAPPPAAESAPADRIVSIQGASCEDLLRLSPEDRDAASMFYIGYQASRFRARTVNVSLIPSIEAQAVTYCAENPRRPVAQAFAEAYSRNRR
jgi:outer membrane biosynthesis protein TonB